MVMFYRWVSRLETMQLPATAFPAAGGDPAVETEETRRLDGALTGGAIASLWMLLQTTRSGSFVTLDWAAVTYLPIFLVALLAVLLVKPQASFSVIAAYAAGYVGLAMLMGVIWATSPLQVIVWGGYFGLVGLVTTVLCVVAWAAALNQLASPHAILHRYATLFRALCVAVILGAALVVLSKAITVPLVGM